MKYVFTIWFLAIAFLLVPHAVSAQDIDRSISFDFYGDSIHFEFNNADFIDFDEKQVSAQTIQEFYNRASEKEFPSITNALFNYKNTHQPDDWLYYQLIRKTVQQISPKEKNYLRYTLYKWYLMIQSGYDPLFSLYQNKLLFYIQCDENIYNIPFCIVDGKQYVCLNYHDYGSNIDFSKLKFDLLDIKTVVENPKTFSYRIHKLPDFNKSDYIEKELRFSTTDRNEYRFNIKVNPQVSAIFKNYPTVDYDAYFNMPVSRETYASLIPLLTKKVEKLNVNDGVAYLMRFTRYAFVYEPDGQHHVSEKRLTPEQTLIQETSDCEDRVFLFYYLVREIYDLPMIAVEYDNHITLAVKFDKPVGKYTIQYEGSAYSICEPTPQESDLNIGQLSPRFRNQKYEVVYAYRPLKN